MSMHRRPAVRCGLAVLLALVAACSAESLSSDDARPVGDVEVAPPSLSLKIGETRQLAATPKGDDGSAMAGRIVFWASRDPAIAAVSDAGLVTAVAPGSTLIAASVGGKSGVASVQVTSTLAASVAVTPSSATVDAGKTTQLSGVARDARGAAITDRPLVWTTSSASIATVSSTGLVTAVAPGSATITAALDGKSAQAAITVRRIPVAYVTVAPTAAVVAEGASVTLVATAHATDGTTLPGRAIAWSTSSAKTATVDANGVVTAVQRGAATITATIEGRAASAIVTVR
jgi:uncharacterized protein YjdB